MNTVTVIKLSQQDFDKLTSARLIVGLISNLGLRELVLRMLLKDVTNLNELLASK